MPPSDPWPWTVRPASLRLAFSDHHAVSAAHPPPHLRRAIPRRRLDFAAGRQAARHALLDLTGLDTPVGRDARGVPVWPAGITGAISHAGGRAAALVGHAARWTGLGVDLESIAPHPGEIASMILSPDERARLGPAPDAQTITLVFSAKESLFKALYPTVQRFFGFEAAELIGLRRGHGRFRLRQPLPPWPCGAEFDFLWTPIGGQVLTAVLVAQARRVAPPSTYRSAMVTCPA